MILGFVLILGLGVFTVAMRWDGSDPARVTVVLNALRLKLTR